MPSLDILHADFRSEPYWWEAYRPTAESPLDVPKQTRVAIVGGGYAGLATALELARLPFDSDVVQRRPELLDVVGAARGNGRRLLIHPDPPRTESEASDIRRAAPSVRLTTPTTLFGT